MSLKRRLNQRKQICSEQFFAQETSEKISEKISEHSINNKSEIQKNRSLMILSEFSRQEIITVLKKKLIRLEKKNHIAELNRKIKQQQIQRKKKQSLQSSFKHHN